MGDRDLGLGAQDLQAFWPSLAGLPSVESGLFFFQDYGDAKMPSFKGPCFETAKHSINILKCGLLEEQGLRSGNRSQTAVSTSRPKLFIPCVF